MHFIRQISCIILFIFFSGCATQMALQPTCHSFSKSGHQLVLMSLKVFNQDRLTGQAETQYITVKNIYTKKSDTFELNAPITKTNMKSVYFISMYLKPGEYQVTNVVGRNKTHFPFNVPNFDVPSDIPFEVEYVSPIYIGRLEIKFAKLEKGAIPREVNRNMTQGGFEMKITNYFHEDIPAFREKYPCLVHVKIYKFIMYKKVK